MRPPNVISSIESIGDPTRPPGQRDKWAGAFLVLVVLVGLSGMVFAAPAASRVQPRQRASVLSREATRLFREGRPSLAAELFRQAYALDPHPGYLYSAGRAWARARHFALARDAYGRVLQMTAQGTEFHLRAASRLSELKKLALAARANRTERPPAVKTAGSDSRDEDTNLGAKRTSARTSHLVVGHAGGWRARLRAWRRPAAVVAWLLSAGAGVFGGVTGFRWQRAQADYANSLSSKGQVIGLTLPEARAKANLQNQQALNGWLSAGVAAVSLAAGALLWRRAPEERSSHERSGGRRAAAVLTFSPMLSTAAQGASVRVRF